MAGPLVANWGGGVNSTALIVGYEMLGIRPDLVIWADTGGEKPETYAYVDTFDAWLQSVGFPPLVRVQNDGMYQTLENDSLSLQRLPSIAYGFKSCSEKYKRRPIDKFLRTWQPAIDAWKRGDKVIKAIGYDMDELRRAKYYDDKKYELAYPLIDWGWTRQGCIMAIETAGLPVPPKSACFFCPSSKKAEVQWLHDNHPDLFIRAIEMEANAELTSVKGLGRSWNWGDYITKMTEEERARVRDNPQEVPCGCYDGDEEDD